MTKCLISLGANLANRGSTLQSAMQQLATVPQTSLLAQSSFRETKPAGGPPQSVYLNAAATLETSLSPQQLLAELQRIENKLGREREERWGPRTIDLDLLLYDQLELETAELMLPHPRMSFRRFVLEPAAEIAAEMVYPINAWTISRLWIHQQKSLPEIGLAPTYSKHCRQSPATRLLKSLVSETYLQPVFRRDFETANPTSAQLAKWRKQRRGSKAPLLPPSDTPVRRNARWVVRDFDSIQFDTEYVLEQAQVADDLTAAFAESTSRLIVVWQPDEAPIMQLLDEARRNRECRPVLWIPKVSLEQARQEVIAAMAAME